MRSFYVAAVAVFLTVGSAAVAVHFFPGVAGALQKDHPAVAGNPPQPGACLNNAAKLCSDLGGLPE